LNRFVGNHNRNNNCVHVVYKRKAACDWLSDVLQFKLQSYNMVSMSLLLIVLLSKLSFQVPKIAAINE